MTLKKLTVSDVMVPLDVPKTKRAEYIKNYLAFTHNTGRVMLFAGDQKVEHLNDDFFDGGKEISLEDADPEHLWKIADKSPVSCLAVQGGYAARYAPSYPKVPLLIKLNSKSHLVKTDQQDPISGQWLSIDQVMTLKKNGANVLAVGYTIYLGSEFENQMITEAAKIVFETHQNGLLTVLWIYPRGKAVKDEKDAHLIAGACGLACVLGSDFVKVNYPKQAGAESEEIFKEAVKAAGRTGVITAGGSTTDPKEFLARLCKQINISGAVGNATGRNIHQKPLSEAINFCKAIALVTFEDCDLDKACQIYDGQKVK
ncbi:MAG: aldolase [Candidatus Komeilibacteria bacterium]|nr:aldolase [Candidatus Komeilibacteria bacterium]